MHRQRSSKAAGLIFGLTWVVFLPLTAIATPFDAFAGNIQQYLAADDSQSQNSLPYHDLQDILLNTPSPAKAREWSVFYTNESHFTGEGQHQAAWTEAKWKEFGILQTTVDPHSSVVTYPDGQRVAVLDLKANNADVIYEAALTEDTGKQSPDARFLPAFNAFAADGNVTAQFFYANFGLREDFEDLLQAGIDPKGKIAIIKSPSQSVFLDKFGIHTERAASILEAQKLGVSAVITYWDPQNDGEISEAHGYQSFPDGPARPSTAIERGTVGHLGSITIPTIPISYADAVPILRTLNGHGPLATDFNPRWHDSGLYHRGVKYNVGPSPKGIVLNLYRNSVLTQGTVYNVIGTIEGGALKDEVVILTNHREGWGPGAGDGSSGSSALNEVARSLGAALKQGWKPLRTIILASLEGQETTHAGSRGWALDNISHLNKTAVALLDVVVAATGGKFHANGSPLLRRAMLHATAQIPSANQSVPGQTVLDLWGGEVLAGSGGDAIHFQAEFCISSLDFGFMPGPGDVPFPYHSQFDTVEWMDAYGDPDWANHMATTKIWALMTAALVETPVLAMNASDYAVFMTNGLGAIQSSLGESPEIDLSPLDDAINRFLSASIVFQAHAASLSARSLSHLSESELSREIHIFNKKYMALERTFSWNDTLLPEFSPRHVVIPPSAYYSRGAVFPFLADAVADGDWPAAEKWKSITIDRINTAAAELAL
ncbi:uncharacterized protein N7459_006266 [Penicillium hispanicum]|uniref:uncharacterized protein n=1 Tax=Penicillium hispanicum TaxID=1080232 RepID=UPI0025415602|nr:uncharacterized protein N7459_006266 [Penicillium hispanicum]KAJ5580281.1 hypothetical protein N7459_006266 [Penicillium hispanicum]